jgi:hypothetical protein
MSSTSLAPVAGSVALLVLAVWFHSLFNRISMPKVQRPVGRFSRMARRFSAILQALDTPGPTVRQIFHWQFSGVLIPSFFGSGVAMIGLALNITSGADIAFVMAYAFFVLCAAWGIGYWWTSTFLEENRGKKWTIERFNLIRFGVSGVMILLLGLCCSATWYVQQHQHEGAEQQRVQALFVHELDKPLVGLYAIFTLTEVMNVTQLSDVAFLLELHNNNTPSKPGLSLSVHSKRDPAPAPGGRFRLGPDGLFIETRSVPGLHWDVWSQGAEKKINVAFEYGYTALNRIETGATPVQPSSFSTLGELDAAYIQIFGSHAMYRAVKKVSLVANDYVIYSKDAKDLAWLPIKLERMEASTGRYQMNLSSMSG